MRDRESNKYVHIYVHIYVYIYIYQIHTRMHTYSGAAALGLWNMSCICTHEPHALHMEYTASCIALCMHVCIYVCMYV